ncbi:Protein CBG27793 [Caenorhabditis briggsae]|uniref:Uncharacterized protein n=2 Tax=Caenorhabditis briggsae TaxID=6238 RepID=A0AAE9CV39_CAEBR|nr:Protein CBG27793 [Caenorhabditis briggsae]ULT83060.1 hypothetical protein L3Y34_012355 [Caenorhabditis briggsae]UMM42357.1 hypothetical protein L5515_018212 [Caenorhabditis briggsae]CAR99560.1 Protein CBG27793 [Caenorhabditis briggsae]
MERNRIVRLGTGGFMPLRRIQFNERTHRNPERITNAIVRGAPRGFRHISFEADFPHLDAIRQGLIIAARHGYPRRYFFLRMTVTFHKLHENEEDNRTEFVLKFENALRILRVRQVNLLISRVPMRLPETNLSCRFDRNHELLARLIWPLMCHYCYQRSAHAIGLSNWSVLGLFHIMSLRMIVPHAYIQERFSRRVFLACLELNIAYIKRSDFSSR